MTSHHWQACPVDYCAGDSTRELRVFLNFFESEPGCLCPVFRCPKHPGGIVSHQLQQFLICASSPGFSREAEGELGVGHIQGRVHAAELGVRLLPMGLSSRINAGAASQIISAAQQHLRGRLEGAQRAR